MKTIAIYILLSISTISNGINQYKVGDTLYIWANEGLNLRMDKNIKSKVIQNLKFGSIVLSNEAKSDKDEDFKLVTNYKNKREENLKGNWLSVRIGELEGFIFDAYLSKYKPVEKEENYTEFLSNNLILISEKNYEDIEDQEVYESCTKRIYSSGSIIEIKNYNEATEQFILIMDFSFEEAILLTEQIENYNQIKKETKLEIQLSSNKKLNTYFHVENFESNLTIEEFNGKVIIQKNTGM